VPFTDGPLEGTLVDPAGIFHGGSKYFALCPPYKSALARKKLTLFLFANLNVLGTLPPRLKNLILIEELINVITPICNYRLL